MGFVAALAPILGAIGTAAAGAGAIAGGAKALLSDGPDVEDTSKEDFKAVRRKQNQRRFAALQQVAGRTGRSDTALASRSEGRSDVLGE